MRWIRPLLTLALAAGCHPAPTFESPPAAWTAPTTIPDAPADPGAPMARMMWMMQYDNRDFDATWGFLHDTATDGPQRDLAIGAAALMGAFELSRFDVIDDGIAALDRAIEAYPDDARLPLWKATLEWMAAYRDGDPEAVAAAYEGLRDTSQDYAGFTLFGLTLALAGDAHASPELLEEGLAAYDAIVADTLGYQVGDEGWRVRRLGDWSANPYNLPGTAALQADMQLLNGDVEGARSSYWEAINRNLSYKWPFREQVQARLDRIDALQEGLTAAPPTEWAYGAGWLGARGITEEQTLEGFAGRIGNGSCTLCHTALTAHDAATVEDEAVGWVRFRWEAPEGIDTPFPVFLGLDGPEPVDPPAGLSVGQVLVDERTTSADGLYTTTMALEPGRWFVVGAIDAGPDRPELSQSTYLPSPIGTPRYIDVEAGQITDLTDSPPLQWEPDPPTE